jgi:hypothetical protein
MITFAVFSQKTAVVRPFFSPLPGRVYSENYSLSATNLIEKYEKILSEDINNKGLVVHFFFDVTNGLGKKAEDYQRLLKESFKSAVPGIRMNFMLQGTEGSVFLNNGKENPSIFHLNALMYASDTSVFSELFLRGSNSRIDTSSTQLRDFRYEFVPVMEFPGTEEKKLFLFRPKLTGKGYACNPNQDEEIVGIFKNIYKCKK